MFILNTLEGAHKTSLRKLVGAFGSELEDQINETYARIRKEYEDGASVKDYIPMFAYRDAYMELMKTYSPKKKESFI